MAVMLQVPAGNIDSIMFGDKSHIVSNYITQQINSLYNYAGNFVDKLVNRLEDAYNSITSSLNRYMMYKNIDIAGYGENHIQACYSWQDLYHANMITRRYIMAHPEVYKLDRENRIEAYGGVEYPLGNNAYDYAKVMDGIITDQGYTKYLYDLLPHDKELDFYEQANIIKTWDVIDWLLENCDFDFTAGEEGKKIG